VPVFHSTALETDKPHTSVPIFANWFVLMLQETLICEHAEEHDERSGLFVKKNPGTIARFVYLITLCWFNLHTIKRN
jgi:hypothetical protein